VNANIVVAGGLVATGALLLAEIDWVIFVVVPTTCFALISGLTLLFASWMLFIENSPWPTLTLIVSLEAIFLSTFVLIGPNRPTAFGQSRPTTTTRTSTRCWRRTRSSPAWSIG
jgi:hypothetical protein